MANMNNCVSSMGSRSPVLLASSFEEKCGFGRSSMPSCCGCCGCGGSNPTRPLSAGSRTLPDRRTRQLTTSCHTARAPTAGDRVQCARTIPVQRTEVVVIGNGPSGICMSYFLSGYWPYYTGGAHPNEMLNMRLGAIDPQKSLLEQDLAFLSDGLEGRSSNPVALLFDALSNPDADIGSKLSSLIRWELHAERAIPHVVLGRYDEGGIWQTIDDDIQTLSLGDWMQLPDMQFAEWREKYISDQVRTSGVKFGPRSNRASAAEVRQYYTDYVDAKGLRQNFTNHSTVTSVERVIVSDIEHHEPDCESGEEGIEMGFSPRHQSQIWEVRGHRIIGGRKEDFCYRAPTVVLATGLFDVPNKLRVRGENQPFVLHSLAELDDRIRHGDIGPNSDPVVVIGSGLSAADAILRARAANIPVAHVFRRDGSDPLTTFRQLPAALYPDYDAVHRLMRAGVSCDGYLCYPSASVAEFTSGREVLLRCRNVRCDVAVRASCAVVLIGSRPNLSFLNGDECQIGSVPGTLIDGKHNPIDVDAITYQSYRRPGLYAIGPLVGDSFVRFLQGGALAVAANVWNGKAKPEKTSASDDAINTHLCT